MQAAKDTSLMKNPGLSQPSSAKTFWFAAGIFWVFLFAEIGDEVRHDHENLFIWVPTLLWLAVCGITLGLERALWHQFPALAPSRRNPSPTHLPVVLGTLCGFLFALAWAKSPLFVLCYDSIKWMTLLLIAGWTLGLVYKLGGWPSLLNACMSAWLAGVIPFCFSTCWPEFSLAPKGRMRFGEPLGV